MDAGLKAKWVKALRSGKYKQARGKLKSRNGALCCIGVGYLCLTGAKPRIDMQTVSASDALGLTPEQNEMLVDMNDYQESNFCEIAGYIEANL